MSIKADFHMHSHHSTDSTADMREMIESAIEKGMTQLCFTEHQDHGYPYSKEFPEGSWMLNIDSYLYELLGLREQYRDKIQVNFGIEIGMQEHVFRENAITAKSHDFDYIIGSIHVVNGFDTYDYKYFDNKTDKQAMEEFFKAELANIKKFQNFDCLGHLDYIVRTVPCKEQGYSPADYQDYIDEMLTFLIENEKGIEINTSALRKGFSNPNPHRDIIKRYKELGGEIITVGSDAHTPADVAGKFDVAEEILKDCGFKYYSTFENRVAFFHKLL